MGGTETVDRSTHLLFMRSAADGRGILSRFKTCNRELNTVFVQSGCGLHQKENKPTSPQLDVNVLGNDRSEGYIWMN